MSNQPADTPSPPPASPTRAARRSPARIILQLVGFTLSMLVLAWCVRTAFGNPAIAEKLPRLLDTPPALLAALLACSFATIALGGLTFWAVLRPAASLPISPLPAHARIRGPLHFLSVNGVCSLLAYLPFKLGLLVRVLIHVNLDRLPLLTVGGWFAATAAVLAMPLAAPLLATALRPRLDALWLAVTLAGIAASALLGWLLARALVTAIDRPDSALGRLGPVALLRRPAGAKLALGLRLLASPRTILVGLALRLADLAVHAARFFVAGQIALAAGIAPAGLTVEQSTLAAATYFTLQLLSPTGIAGLREGGTIGLLQLFPGWMAEGPFAAVVLVVTAGEAAANTLAGAAGALHLRVTARRAADAPAPEAPR